MEGASEAMLELQNSPRLPQSSTMVEQEANGTALAQDPLNPTSEDVAIEKGRGKRKRKLVNYREVDPVREAIKRSVKEAAMHQRIQQDTGPTAAVGAGGAAPASTNAATSGGEGSMQNMARPANASKAPAAGDENRCNRMNGNTWRCARERISGRKYCALHAKTLRKISDLDDIISELHNKPPRASLGAMASSGVGTSRVLLDGLQGGEMEGLTGTAGPSTKRPRVRRKGTKKRGRPSKSKKPTPGPSRPLLQPENPQPTNPQPENSWLTNPQPQNPQPGPSTENAAGPSTTTPENHGLSAMASSGVGTSSVPLDGLQGGEAGGLAGSAGPSTKKPRVGRRATKKRRRPPKSKKPTPAPSLPLLQPENPQPTNSQPENLQPTNPQPENPQPGPSAQFAAGPSGTTPGNQESEEDASAGGDDSGVFGDVIRFFDVAAQKERELEDIRSKAETMTKLVADLNSCLRTVEEKQRVVPAAQGAHTDLGAEVARIQGELDKHPALAEECKQGRLRKAEAEKDEMQMQRDHAETARSIMMQGLERENRARLAAETAVGQLRHELEEERAQRKACEEALAKSKRDSANLLLAFQKMEEMRRAAQR